MFSGTKAGWFLVTVLGVLIAWPIVQAQIGPDDVDVNHQGMHVDAQSDAAQDIERLVERGGDAALRGGSMIARTEYQAEQVRLMRAMHRELVVMRKLMQASADTAQEPMPSVFPIDPNVASKQELMLLPYVGMATADRIIAYRETVEPPAFTEPADFEPIRYLTTERAQGWVDSGAVEFPTQPTE